MAPSGTKLSSGTGSEYCDICNGITIVLDPDDATVPRRNASSTDVHSIDGKSYISGELSYHQKSALFHDAACATCQPRPSISSPLCNFCAHLRLGHLFRCGQPPRKVLLGIFRPPISSSHFSYQSRKGCVLCAYMEKRTNSAYGDTIYFRFRRRPDSGSSTASQEYTALGQERIQMLPGDPTQTTVFLDTAFLGAPEFLSHDQDWSAITKRLALCNSEHSACNQKRYDPRNHSTVRRAGTKSLQAVRMLTSRLSPIKMIRMHSADPCFRLIDVQKKCLTSGSLRSRFAALSYVWGDCQSSPKLKACQENITRLMEPGALASKIPRTINDAIKVCVRLDIPYLWVDRLCIVQDDDKDVEKQVQSMGDVFASAYVVLVALANNMDSGIPGITSSPQLKELYFDGLKLVQSNFTDSGGLVDERDKAAWSSRGWTYQEAALARRILYLGSGHAWVRCKKPDVLAGEPAEEDFVKGIDHSYRCKQQEWNHHLQNYIHRVLREPTDIYNAFSGISNAIYGPDSLYYGLPRDDFETNLAFEPSVPRRAQQNRQTPLIRWDLRYREIPDGVPPSFQLPTWSWASIDWTVPQESKAWRVTIKSKDFDHGSRRSGRPLVSWAANRKTDEKCFTIIQDEPPEASALEHAWIQGAITYDSLFQAVQSAGLPPKRWYNESWDWLLEYLDIGKIAKKHACTQELVLQFHARNPQELVLQFPWHEEVYSTLRPGTLLGRVQRAYLRLDADDGAISNMVWPLHHHDRIVGQLCIISPCAENEIFPRVEANEPFELIALLADQMHIKDMILNMHGFTRFMYLPARVKSDLENDDFLYDKSRVLTFYDRNGETSPEIPIVRVMAVGRRGPIAHRITVGWVLLTAWLKLKRDTITILLE